MSMESDMLEMQEKSSLEAETLEKQGKVALEWAQRVIENAYEDKANSKTYLYNATSEISAQVAKAILLIDMVEQIQKIKKYRKFKHDGFAQSVVPVLIIGKLLQLITEEA